jgi:membrane protease YdiL (CAAX protease family)
MKRLALPISIAVILAHWLYEAAALFVRQGGAPLPDSVVKLALFVCAKTAVLLAVVWPLLRAGGEHFSDLGIGLQPLRHALFPGTLFAVGLFLLVNVLLGSVLSSLGGGGTAPAVRALFRDPREAPLWAFCAVAGGGFNEELERAFVLTRFERAFGRWGLALAVATDSAVFGVGHLYQGAAGAVKAGLEGVLFALLFLWRRRAADAMVAHAGGDLLGVAAAYALYAGDG